MKKDIHPNYNTNCEVKCACGMTLITGSTKDSIYVEICSNCHPFYTGKQKLIDTARRVELFEAKAKKTAAMGGKKGKKAKRAKKNDDATTKSLKDQLKEATGTKKTEEKKEEKPAKEKEAKA